MLVPRRVAVQAEVPFEAVVHPAHQPAEQQAALPQVLAIVVMFEPPVAVASAVG